MHLISPRLTSAAKGSSAACLAVGIVLSGLAFAARSGIAPTSTSAVPLAPAIETADPFAFGRFILPLLRPVAWRLLARSVD